MPPIKNWDKSSGSCEPLHAEGWKHTDTGEIICLSNKVKGDGYYAYKYETEKDVGREEGERIAFESTKAPAKRSTVEKLRNNPNGF